MIQIQVHRPGRMDYQRCWDWQEELFAATVSLKTQNRERPESQQILPPHHLILVEHDPVFTLGKSGKREHILWDEETLNKMGIQFYPINRGGDITYHGPGQCVGYPILDLDQIFTDIHKYLRYLEEVMIRVLAEYGIRGDRLEGFTGVWLDPHDADKARKICAMGIRASRWVTMHGWALNVNTNLSHFEGIVPCGIDDKAVTSMEKELGRKVDLKEVEDRILVHFAEVFGVEMI